MTDHPEFPQESPAIKYIVDQVSKVDDTANCSIGYYKSLGKVISRLDKTDVELNRLHQSVIDLKKITDSDVIATCIGKKSDETQEIIRSGIDNTNKILSGIVSARMDSIRADHKDIIAKIDSTNDRSKRIQNDLSEQMGIAIARLDNHIKNVDERLSPPLWKIWIYILLSVGIGLYIGGRWL
jgi:uncharacterized 2Fe-2S/4Fe-4S cluster protein (DUF4445 family)